MKNLQRFIDAQEKNYTIALAELKTAKKTGHWMWYIFPQVQGLGFSSMSKHYAIEDANEAQEYLKHPVLGTRLVQISQVLLKLPETSAHSIFGSPDDVKLKSSMTLFAMVPGADPAFQQVLDKFFNGIYDPKTLHIINTPPGSAPQRTGYK